MNVTARPPATPVRLPAELRSWLKHSAVDNHRSLSSEIIHRLELSRTSQVQQKGNP